MCLCGVCMSVCTYSSLCWTLQNRVLRARWWHASQDTCSCYHLLFSRRWCALVIIKTSSFDVPGTGCTMYQYIAQDVQYQGGCRVKMQRCCVIINMDTVRPLTPLSIAWCIWHTQVLCMTVSGAGWELLSTEDTSDAVELTNCQQNSD